MDPDGHKRKKIPNRSNDWWNHTSLKWQATITHRTHLWKPPSVRDRKRRSWIWEWSAAADGCVVTFRVYKCKAADRGTLSRIPRCNQPLLHWSNAPRTVGLRSAWKETENYCSNWCSYSKRLESFWILNPFEIFCPVKSTIGTDWRLEKTNTLELTDEIVRESIRNEKMASYQFSFSRHRARISISFSARTLPSSELPISWNNDSPILNETRVVKFEKKVLL